MSKPRLLSGEEIVAKGATKVNASLPEIGLKDVTPNGSWLEQKQIQSALDARKQLIEIERIEKCGALSHAIWREDRMLAEVTKKTGGYWQYLGHNIDNFLYFKPEKVLYLKPEEALYLMEVNCLQLKYNEVTVSLQQAYTLLLRDQVSIMQYKVYASLSRLGYKVFRFSEPKTGDKTNVDAVETKVNTTNMCLSENDQNNITETEITPKVTEDMEVDEKIPLNSSENKAEVVCDSEQTNETISNIDKNVECESVGLVDDVKDQNVTNNNGTNAGQPNKEENGIDKTANVVETSAEGEKLSANQNNSSIKENEAMDVEQPAEVTKAADIQTNNGTVKDFSRSHKTKTLSRRRLRNQSTRDNHKYFNTIPELLHKDSVTIIVPKQHLPEQVNPMYASYEVNLNTVRTRKTSSPQNETVNESINTATTTTTYNTNERRTEYRFESTFSTHQGHNNYFYTNVRFHRPPPVYNQFQFWRPRMQWNSFPYNVFIQRPFIRNTFYSPRFHFFPRQAPPEFIRPVINTTPSPAYARPTNNINENSSSSTSSRKRARNNEQTLRLDTIKNLAMKLKNRRTPRHVNMGLINFIESLIHIYNGRYRPRIYLTDTFDIEENEFIVDTITLDDDEVVSKKRKVAENSMFEENFTEVQQLASKLKELESKGLATARHRRALSSVVKIFNVSFDADIYVNECYQVVDRRQIILDSSSDSECIVNESERKKGVKKNKRGKKVRNPFNLLKTLAEKNRQGPSCSKDVAVEDVLSEDNVVSLNKDIGSYSEEMKRNFKSWLPKSNDFGRAETVPKSLMISRIVESNKLAFLYDFIKHQNCKFINWLDVKISFLENMEYAAALFNDEHVMESSSDWNSIIKPEDCKDMPSVLNKLSIIPNKNDTNEETSLKIDFDVYNRDVQNFKKRDVPKPHFRIVCIKDLYHGECESRRTKSENVGLKLTIIRECPVFYINQSSELPLGPDVAALHNRYGDVPIVFAVVGESVSYLQINPINLPMFIPERETV